MRALLLAITIFLCSNCMYGQIITTIAGGGASFPGDGVPATNSSLGYTAAIVRDTAGNLFIADANNNRIRKVNPAGIITTIAGGGIGGLTDGIPATDATFNNPLGIALAPDGTMYIADNGTNRIRKVTPAGITYIVAGTGSPAYTGDGGPATAATINNPQDVAVDTAGNLYIADNGNAVVRKVNKAGIISTYAGSTYGYSGDGGPATVAQLIGPGAVMADSAGNIFISDGNTIRKVNDTGTIYTIAGNNLPGYAGDSGQATNASLNFPKGLREDASGNLFFADWRNNVIRKIDVSGVITTVAGNGYGAGMSTGAFSGDGGPALLAELYYPVGVETDKNGNLYIADGENTRVRKVTPRLALRVGSPECVPELSLYPNPNRGCFKVKGLMPSISSEHTPIEITNVTGEVMYQSSVPADKGHICVQVSLSNLPGGSYFLHAGSKVVTFVIEQ